MSNAISLGSLRLKGHSLYVPVYRLGRRVAFPDPRRAEPSGLLAVGGDLSAARLIEAYRNGIFPWPLGEGQPLTWFSPAVRCVFEPGRLRVNRSLRRTLRSGRYGSRVDTRFTKVMLHCARTERPGQPGTWITHEMVRAYSRLHRQGFAHSVETWRDGRLVGGLYGVTLGAVFFAESMFHDEPDASKFALHSLSELLVARGFSIIDAQIPSPFLSTLGAVSIARDEFLDRLNAALDRECRFP